MVEEIQTQTEQTGGKENASVKFIRQIEQRGPAEKILASVFLRHEDTGSWRKFDEKAACAIARVKDSSTCLALESSTDPKGKKQVRLAVYRINEVSSVNIPTSLSDQLLLGRFTTDIQPSGRFQFTEDPDRPRPTIRLEVPIIDDPAKHEGQRGGIDLATPEGQFFAQLLVEISKRI